MSATLRISIARDTATPALDGLLRAMNGSERVKMNEAMGNRIRFLVESHFMMLAATRHETAEKLGAAPSGHWAQAAEKVSSAPITATASGVTLTISQPGIGRALHDVTITAGTQTPGKQFLALPVIAAAYNQRAAGVPGLVAVVNGDRGVLMMPEKGSGFGTVWYVLVRQVHQPQDRTLLPADEEFMTEAMKGIRDYLEMELGKAAA